VSERTRFSLAGASAAADDGDEEIARWVGDFLASRGSDNAVLAAALAQEPHWWFGPVTLPVELLVRLAGPEDEALCDIDPDEWEDDVDGMRDSIDDGWEPPPVLVEWQEGKLLLQDGNHRFEALAREGASDVWALVYFPSLAARDRFAADYLEELRTSGPGTTPHDRVRTPTRDA
jgi:hypothetical protein